MSKGRKISITQDELNKKLAKGLIRGYKVMSSEKEKPKKKNKYGNQKVVIDGIKFDSKKEGNRYFELKMLQLAGEISGLKMQEKYELNKGGTHSLVYKADFVYFERGIEIVEDVKGYRTKTYLKKKRLMEQEYGIIIKEM